MFFAVFEIYCISYLTVMAHLKFGPDAFQVLKIIMQIVSCECMFLGSLSHHNKDLEQQTLKPLACHGSQVLDKPYYSS